MFPRIGFYTTNLNELPSCTFVPFVVHRVFSVVGKTRGFSVH